MEGGRRKGGVALKEGEKEGERDEDGWKKGELRGGEGEREGWKEGGRKEGKRGEGDAYMLITRIQIARK